MGKVRSSQPEDMHMSQKELFDVPQDVRERQFRVRMDCYIAYLKEQRESPDPLPAELSAGRVLNTHRVVQGAQP